MLHSVWYSGHNRHPYIADHCLIFSSLGLALSELALYAPDLAYKSRPITLK